ncbi:glycosyltransferase [Oceanobacillus sp. CF4.6]|uniref:glycosyltransferase n=1 Tax=Oceanobacillus sp. CF4.6 TaxID=3373080 RepID=UPI003EE7A5E3
MNPTISIIVPIYNVELYLANCIDSILAQTFKDFELILINDGSIDKSGEICDFYMKRDSRINVIHKSNGGVSSARNNGIDIARGNYIAFVDPDDTLETTMYYELIRAAFKHKADMIVCPIKIINTRSNTISNSSIWKDVDCVLNKQIIESEIIPSIVANRTYSIVSSVNKLYKSSLFASKKIRFDQNLHYSEDARLNFSLLTMINSLVYVGEPLYNYYIRDKESLTQRFNANLYDYVLDNKIFLIELCKKYNLVGKINSVRNHFSDVTLTYIQDVIANEDIINKEKYKILTRIMKDEEFYEDLLLYKCPSHYYRVLRYLCIKRKLGLLIYLVSYKMKLQNFYTRINRRHS